MVDDASDPKRKKFTIENIFEDPYDIKKYKGIINKKLDEKVII